MADTIEPYEDLEQKVKALQDDAEAIARRVHDEIKFALGKGHPDLARRLRDIRDDLRTLAGYDWK